MNLNIIKDSQWYSWRIEKVFNIIGSLDMQIKEIKSIIVFQFDEIESNEINIK